MHMPFSPSAGECGIEYNIDFAGKDVSEKKGVPDVASCKKFCQSDKYFTWKSKEKKCYCKSSDSGSMYQDGSYSGKTVCRKFDRDLKFFKIYLYMF